MKNLNELRVQEISQTESRDCNGGFWVELLVYLLERNADYQAFKAHTGQSIN